jgi:hypothetical protein
MGIYPKQQGGNTMELLLKRDEKPGALGTRYDLFAKLEAKPEEVARIRKANPDKTIIVEDAFGRNNVKWRLMLIPAGVIALMLGYITFFWIHPILFLPVTLLSWLPIRKLFFNQTTGNVTVADILTGRTIHCKSLDELYAKEHDIKEKISNYCQYMEGMASLGSEQRIDLSRG